jgi:hypothetical protein
MIGYERFRRYALAAIGVLAVAFLGIVPASQAHAAQVALLCLKNASPQYCMATHGLDVQITAQASGGQTYFFLDSTNDAGFYKIKVSGTTDHCVEGLNNTSVRVETCESGNDQQEWQAFSNGHNACVLHTRAQTTRYQVVYDPTNGSQPWWDDSNAGGYRAMSYVLWSPCT